jgi:hypothetical protein
MAVSSFGAVRGGLLASLRQRKATESSNDPDNSKNVFSRFRPPYQYHDGVGGAASTSDAGINYFQDGEGNAFQIRLEQGHAAATIGTAAARGLSLALDATGADGVAMDLGYGASASEIANCRGAFVIGTDEDFYLRIRLEIGDVSDSSQVAVAFVGTAAGWPDDGVLDTYGNYAALNVDGGQVNIETRLNTGTASVTDTGTDIPDYASTGDVYDLEIRVSKGGAVNFLINGAEPTTDVTGFVFDTGDTVNAVLMVLSDVDSDPGVVVHEWESGYLSSRGPDGILDLED